MQGAPLRLAAALLADIRFSSKGLSWENTLAYCAYFSFTNIKKCNAINHMLLNLLCLSVCPLQGFIDMPDICG